LVAEQYRITFTSDSGEAVLDDLRRRFGNRGSFVPDSNVTAFHEGQRDVYLLCLQMMEKDIRRTNPPPPPTHEETESDA